MRQQGSVRSDFSNRWVARFWVVIAAGMLTGPAVAQNVVDDFGSGVRVELPKDGVTPNYWLVDLKVEGLKMISARSGPGRGRVYWYLLYTLENKSDEAREAFISISATSDRGAKYVDMFLPNVELEIERKEGRALWGKADEFALQKDRSPDDLEYLLMPIEGGSKRRSVAVFNRLDPNANQVTIRIKGLSNEIRRVETEDGTVLEEKVLELTFHRPGDEFAITQDTFYPKQQNWVVDRIKLNVGG